VKKQDYDSLVKEREEIKRVLSTTRNSLTVRYLGSQLNKIRLQLKDAHREQYNHQRGNNSFNRL
jgi:hypothetical protein